LVVGLRVLPAEGWLCPEQIHSSFPFFYSVFLSSGRFFYNLKNIYIDKYIHLVLPNENNHKQLIIIYKRFNPLFYYLDFYNENNEVETLILNSNFKSVR
jgi:hypothetical protein